MSEASTLLTLQRQIAAAVMQPLTRQDSMRRVNTSVARQFIKPNDRLSAPERLEIYNRQYWFRVLSCFAEDFPGLQAVVGARAFDKLSRAYLSDCPSTSFTLRNLGSQLDAWLQAHPDFLGAHAALALDMVRLEWAHIEAFDSQAAAPLTLADLDTQEDPVVALQPHLRLLELHYAVDDLLIAVRQYQGDSSTAANAARTGPLRKAVQRHRLPETEPVYLAVHRFDNTVYYKRLGPQEFRLLGAFRRGVSLAQALASTFPDESSLTTEILNDIQHWFANWSELGWLARSAQEAA